MGLGTFGQISFLLYEFCPRIIIIATLGQTNGHGADSVFTTILSFLPTSLFVYGEHQELGGGLVNTRILAVLERDDMAHTWENIYRI